MVVLSNESVRSGKEALAYQFKRTKRAFVVGRQTAGAFVAGKGFFADENLRYLLYLAVKGVLRDGNDLGGRGIAPDREVVFPLGSTLAEDPQLRAALEHFGS